MSARIRDADIARDKPALQRFIAGSNAFESQFESDRRLDDALPAEFLPELVGRAATKQGRVFVADEGGAVVGWAVCYVDHHETFVREEERPFGYVAEMFVDEAFRGRHFGRMLLKACEDHFRTLGVKSVLIGALAPNTRAVNAYRAAGYVDYAIEFRKGL
jgi:ribosomal protein S18 acetylase RimI-like enzyme